MAREFHDETNVVPADIFTNRQEAKRAEDQAQLLAKLLGRDGVYTSLHHQFSYPDPVVGLFDMLHANAHDTDKVQLVVAQGGKEHRFNIACRFIGSEALTRMQGALHVDALKMPWGKGECFAFFSRKANGPVLHTAFYTRADDDDEQFTPVDMAKLGFDNASVTGRTEDWISAAFGIGIDPKAIQITRFIFLGPDDPDGGGPDGGGGTPLPLPERRAA